MYSPVRLARFAHALCPSFRSFLAMAVGFLAAWVYVNVFDDPCSRLDAAIFGDAAGCAEVRIIDLRTFKSTLDPALRTLIQAKIDRDLSDAQPMLPPFLKPFDCLCAVGQPTKLPGGDPGHWAFIRDCPAWCINTYGAVGRCAVGGCAPSAGWPRCE